jgi:two-component system, NarL family, nitrate/nitrite response regulator NarL
MSTPSQGAIRVLIVDDHTVMRTGLRMLLESQPGITVVGEAGNCADAVTAAAREQPDVILLDLALGAESALDCLPRLRTAAGSAAVLILTGVHNPKLYTQAVRLGALGVVLKETAPETLLRAIERVHAGEVWLERAMMASVLNHMTQASPSADPEAARIATLTKREHDVIVLVGQGLRNRQIAERLLISESTVRHHLTSIYTKLGVSDRLELVIYAYQHGLTRPSS